jgi:Tfp pilus assembly protein PilE
MDQSAISVLKKSRLRGLCTVVLIIYCVVGQIAMAQEESLSREDRSKAKEMLHNIHDDIREHYFDKKYQGVDLDARFKVAEQKIETAPSMNYALADIAAATAALNDSHTFLSPQPGLTSTPTDSKCKHLAAQIVL